MEDSTFPRFQWSIFPNGKDGAQVVVRNNDWSSFILDIERVRADFINLPPTSQPKETTTPGGSSTPANPKRICDNCGAEMTFKEGVGKTTNKPYKGYFCSENCGAKPVFIR